MVFDYKIRKLCEYHTTRNLWYLKVRLNLVVECLAVLMCISEVSFGFTNIDSLCGEYLETWEGERIGSGSYHITGFVTRDVEYFGYPTTTIGE